MPTYYSNLSPAPGALGATQEEARWTPITVEVTPNSGELPLIMAEFGTEPYDIYTVFDGAEFSPRWREHSTVAENTPIAGTYSFSLLPVGGWMYSTFDLTFGSVLEVAETLSYLMPDPPTEPPPELSESGKLLGRDILFQQGDLRVGANGDYKTVEGPDNLRLAIVRRIIIAQREYQLEPNFGAGAGKTLKAPASEAELEQLEGRIVTELERDRRIIEVTKLKLERRQELPGALRIFVSVKQLEENEPVNFSLNLPEL